MCILYYKLDYISADIVTMYTCSGLIETENDIMRLLIKYHKLFDFERLAKKIERNTLQHYLFLFFYSALLHTV